MTENSDEFLTAKQVAAMLRLDERTIQRMAEKEVLPYTDVGLGSRPRYRFKRSDVERYLSERERRPEQAEQ